MLRLRFTLPLILLVISTSAAHGQIAYGVDSSRNLFRFDVNQPLMATVIGTVPFLPEAIDFRPGTESLYAIDIGPVNTQLYTIDIVTAAATPVGAGFPSSGAGYNLSPNDRFGFDFNPKTLQADNSMRIRLVSTSTANLRLNSATGLIAAVDGNLQFANGNAPFVDAAAYINNIPEMGGTTQLFDMDSRNDALLLQDPPNAGTVSTIGPFGVAVDAVVGIGFDIFTTLGDADPTIGGDTAFAALRRQDAAGDGISPLFYRVDLATGTIFNGALVGVPGQAFDFDGGLAINPIPEPIGSIWLAVIGFALAMRRSRNRRSS